MQILRLLWLANLLGCLLCIVLAVVAILSIAHSRLRQALFCWLCLLSFSASSQIYFWPSIGSRRVLFLKNDAAVAAGRGPA